MSPAEHYAQAEKLLGAASKLYEGDPTYGEVVAAAQVHALLALAPNPPVIHVVNPR